MGHDLQVFGGTTACSTLCVDDRIPAYNQLSGWIPLRAQSADVGGWILNNNNQYYYYYQNCLRSPVVSYWNAHAYQNLINPNP